MKRLLIMFLAVATLCACEKHENDHDNTKPDVVADSTLAPSRTVLAYMVAENSLSTFVNDDLNEMLRGMNDSTLHEGDKLLIYIDDTRLPRIYSLTKSSKALNLEQMEAERRFDEDCNSASAERLEEIIDYMLREHTAESYGLVMWSHASGWIPSTNDDRKSAGKSAPERRQDSAPRKSLPRKSFGIDNGKNLTFSNTGSQMDIDDMARVIERKCKFEFIFFDACFMQCVEVDYALRHCAKYIIASPAEIPGPGADYSVMMKPMFKASDCSQAMVDTYYNTYYNDVSGTYNYVDGINYGVIISAVDESALNDFAAYMKRVCANHRTELQSVNPDDVLTYFSIDNYHRSPMPDFMDMQGIMTKTLFGVEFDEWKSEIGKVVIANKFTPRWISMFSSNTRVIPDHCGGMSMFVPIEGRYTEQNGDFINKIKQTQWGQMIWQQ